MKIQHKTRVALAALAIVGGAMATGAVSAGPAAAAIDCTHAASWNFYDSSGHLAAIGYFELDGTTLCAELVAQGAYYGERKLMEVDINNGAGTTYKEDRNYYYYYAGPITYPNPGYPVCAQVHFQMDDSGGNQILNYSPRIFCD